MTERPLTWLDVFTATPLAGNQLAVVHDADDLDDATMLAFARETKLSETAFVQSGDADCHYRNRIWMATGELRLAGHPSLGTAVAVAHRAGQARVEYVQRTPSGLQPVRVELDGRLARASMLQQPAEFEGSLDGDRALDVLGLDGDAGHPDLRPELVSTGILQLLLPLRDAEALAAATPVPAALADLLAETGAVTLYPFVIDQVRRHAAARSFFTSLGGRVEEDPATGAAAGPLMAYLERNAGLDAVVVEQGVQMGRPSRLECTVEGERVRVGGDVVILGRGSVQL